MAQHPQKTRSGDRTDRARGRGLVFSTRLLPIFLFLFSFLSFPVSFNPSDCSPLLIVGEEQGPKLKIMRAPRYAINCDCLPTSTWFSSKSSYGVSLLARSREASLYQPQGTRKSSGSCLKHEDGKKARDERIARGSHRSVRNENACEESFEIAKRHRRIFDCVVKSHRKLANVAFSNFFYLVSSTRAKNIFGEVA